MYKSELNILISISLRSLWLMYFFKTTQILRDPKLPLTYIEHSLEQVG